jgi:DNA-binding LacI/PurR family transcriptional regulator
LTTIYDVAEHAGVSIATVSKVLSGRLYVSTKTRERVLSSVRALNYVPNAAARSLAGERTNIIGVVLAYAPHDLFADPNLLQGLYGIDAEITERACTLLLSCARSADDRLSAFRHLLSGYRADGVIVEGSLGEEGIALLAASEYPCVVMGYSQLELPSVHPDDYEGARLMTAHLLQLGHRRIGVITGPVSADLVLKQRLGGYRDVLQEAGLAFDEALVAFGTWRADSGYEGAAKLMDLDPPPSAIFCFNDRMAFGAIRWLREHGCSVPQEVSVAGFDDIESARQFTPPLTTVHQRPAEIGRCAARMLFDLIDGSGAPAETVVLPVELVVRRSTAPLGKEVYGA